MNQPETEPKTRESVKFFGISSQINLRPGSETHRRFAQHMKDAGILSARSFVEKLMDAYETPHVETDNSEVIANLEQQLADAQSEISDYQLTVQNNEAEIEDLKKEIEQRIEQNKQICKGFDSKNNVIQQLQEQIDGAIIVKPNPVVAFFLNEMAEKENTTPAKILERLFIDDLQNPRANNLPYTVGSDRIRDVLEKLKKEEAEK